MGFSKTRAATDNASPKYQLEEYDDEAIPVRSRCCRSVDLPD